jgi:predicted enzyme related to lactoylglutathione lyase
MALPRMDIPGVGAVAYVKDTEGNVLGMLQPV